MNLGAQSLLSHAAARVLGPPAIDDPLGQKVAAAVLAEITRAITEERVETRPGAPGGSYRAAVRLELAGEAALAVWCLEGEGKANGQARRATLGLDLEDRLGAVMRDEGFHEFRVVTITPTRRRQNGTPNYQVLVHLGGKAPDASAEDLSPDRARALGSVVAKWPPTLPESLARWVADQIAAGVPPGTQQLYSRAEGFYRVQVRLWPPPEEFEAVHGPLSQPHTAEVLRGEVAHAMGQQLRKLGFVDFELVTLGRMDSKPMILLNLTGPKPVATT